MDNLLDQEKPFYTQPEYWESLVTAGKDYPYPKYIKMVREGVRLGELRAWESFKRTIESSNIMVCGDTSGVPDVKGSLAFFKKALTLRADEMIKKIKGYEQPRMAAK